MTPEEKYLFDLHGYILVRNAIPAALVARMNTAIDELEKLSDDEVTAMGASRNYAREDMYAKVGEVESGILRDYGMNVLACGGAFEELIDLPTTLPYIETLVGDDCRLDAVSFLSRNSAGAFRFHHGYAELLPYSEYAYESGEFKCVSVKISYALSDVGVEDGCFTVIPGSHKSNFTNPLVGAIPDPNHPLVEPLPARAGDAILFSEDLSHGAVENRGSKTRRTLFYSYAPPFHCRWHALGETSSGFEERASARRLELIRGPVPY